MISSTLPAVPINVGIQRLLPRHYGILRLVLSGLYNFADIGRMTGYTAASIRVVVDSPLFQMELARRRQDIERAETGAVRDGLTQARDLLTSTALGAVETLEQGLLGGVSKDRLLAADKILKYALPQNDKNVSQASTVVVLSDKGLDRLRQVLSEVGITRSEGEPSEAA